MENHMVAASIYLPKDVDDPSHARGDDAHFIAADQQFVGVADGGEYARRLMFNSLMITLIDGHAKSPMEVIEEAYAKTTTTQGSSTACIISFSSEDNMLRAACVGDSGFLVIRNGAVLYRSSSIDCPYDDRVGTTEDIVAEEIEVRVEKGDLVILGTDGLFDNMFEREMLEILLERGGGDMDLVEQCSYVANYALFNSFDSSRSSYSIDDITVIIARID
ncbi:hypothetical protein CASFOL_027004 [Castilleja foliolosa]|uniref:Protein phosphatase n=1 Tax=Castilleja foliolosa TaxID=1961234 RepID=A0ABD3CJY6_9LAMI